MNLDELSSQGDYSEATIGDEANQINIGKEINSLNNNDVADGSHAATIADRDINQTTIAGNVESDGDFVARDKTIHGDDVGGDKVAGDKIMPQGYVAIGGQVVHVHLGTLGPVEQPQPQEAPMDGAPPYQGLNYFGFADAHLFFGRERLTAELAAYLRAHRFLAVVGASGSGKSSLVRAGVIPALHYGQPLADGMLPPAGSQHWPIHIMQPKAHPLRELAATLLPDQESDLAQLRLMDELAQDARVLGLRASRLLSGGAAARLLLVVDQFEELFTLCKDLSERKAFIDNLLMAAADDGVTTVVITLRADFYAHCFAFDNLRAALEGEQKNIGPMTKEELRRAIEAPARLGGWELENGLVELLLADVGNEPGALPLLSHALLETWKRRRGRTLTLAGYAESGRVQGAIAQTAEAVFKQLATPQQQAIAKNIFLRLTELGEGAEDTRRRVQLAELMPKPQEKATIENVLQTLADARLVTTDKEEVEVAHEALIRSWPMLRGWLDENREGIRLQRRLLEDAQRWDKELDRDREALYSGRRLEQVAEWESTSAFELSDLEQTFLEASKARAARERRQRRLTSGTAIAAALLIIVVLGGGLFIQQRNQATYAQLRNEAAAAKAAWQPEVAAQKLTAANAIFPDLFDLDVEIDAVNREIATAWFDEAQQLKINLQPEDAIAKLAAAHQLYPNLFDEDAEMEDVRRQVATSWVQDGEKLAKAGNYDGAGAKFWDAINLKPPSDTPVYVWIEGGAFTMGSTDEDGLANDDEKPAHTVNVDGFWIGRTEVTNAQYIRCVDAEVCDPPNNNRYANPALAANPVTEVDWNQAKTYAEWVGGRLPSEAEWENACRGTDDRRYPWSNDPPTYEYANFDYNVGSTTAVGSYPPGANGLFDMAGNVWEWTADWYDGEYYKVSPEHNPTGPEEGDRRTLRGGSWFNYEVDVRCAVRYSTSTPSTTTTSSAFGWLCRPPACELWQLWFSGLWFCSVFSGVWGVAPTSIGAEGAARFFFAAHE